jgi:hypothetical protein
LLEEYADIVSYDASGALVVTLDTGTIGGIVSTGIDWSEVGESEIDNETPAQTAQWCQVNKASFC